MAELQARMSWTEWLDWCAYFALLSEDGTPAPPAAGEPASGNPLLDKFRTLIEGR